jgi:hypothetical protein
MLFQIQPKQRRPSAPWRKSHHLLYAIEKILSQRWDKSNLSGHDDEGLPSPVYANLLSLFYWTILGCGNESQSPDRGLNGTADRQCIWGGTDLEISLSLFLPRRHHTLLVRSDNVNYRQLSPCGDGPQIPKPWHYQQGVPWAKLEKASRPGWAWMFDNSKAYSEKNWSLVTANGR